MCEIKIQTGAAFALNALYEASRVELISGAVNEIITPSPSGKGQTITRCPKCEVAIWSSYFMGGIKNGIRFIRVGTLNSPDLLPPDVHIYTKSKQPWINLSPDDSAVKEFYDYERIWTSDNLKILKSLRANTLDE